MFEFFKKISNRITFKQNFFLFVIIAFIFILIYPNTLYPDFDNLNRNFKNVFEAFFTGSIVVKSKTFGGSLEEHKLLFDQLFLTPQIKIIQLGHFFFDVSIIRNADLQNFYVKLYFFTITAVVIFCLHLIDDVFSNNKKDNNEKN